MSTTVQEIFNNCGSTSYPEIARLTQLTFTGDSNPIWNGSVTIADTGTGSFILYTASVFNFSFASTASLHHVLFGGGSKRALTYNLDKKLVVVTDVSPADTSATNPTYICYPRIGLLKSATNWMFRGKTSRDRYLSNETCASHYDTIFKAFNYGDPYALGNDSRKSVIGDIALYKNFYIKFTTDSESYTTTGSVMRVGDGIYLADGDIAGLVEDVGKIISDGTKAYICCGYRLWMEYEGGAV